MKTLVAVLAVTVAIAAYAAAPKGQIQVPIDAAKWEEPMGPNSIQTSAVNGDAKKGPYTVLMKMPAGFDSGWHTHDSDYSGVVVSGTIQNIEQGGEAAAKPMGPGSWWMQPAKKNHDTKCDAASECLILLSIKGGFTFNAMTAEGKPAPKEKKEEAKPAK